MEISGSVMLPTMLALAGVVPFDAQPGAGRAGDGADIPDGAKSGGEGKALAGIVNGHGVGLVKWVGRKFRPMLLVITLETKSLVHGFLQFAGLVLQRCMSLGIKTLTSLESV